MACFSPFSMQVPYFHGSTLKKVVKVPCNYCLSCRITRSIYLRSIASYENYLCSLRGFGSSFSTLTYCDYNLPISLDSGLATLSKDDFQRFMKRLRKNLSKDFGSFKFMASGEYGDQFGRPHYHLTLFGIPSSVASKAIFDAWNNPELIDYTGVIRGHTDVGALRAGGLAYVTKYCLKQVRGKEITDLYDNNYVTPPFIVHSQNLEKQFILRELKNLRESGWRSTFFGRPSFIPAKVLKKYASDYEYKQYVVSCIRYLKSKPLDEIARSAFAKERSLYFQAINSGNSANNDILRRDIPEYL